MNLVAGAVEETGIDEDDAPTDRANTFAQVHRRAPFLVHDTDLQRIPLDAEQVLDPAEQRIGVGRLMGPVHFRFDDINAAGPAVRLQVLAAAICHRAGRRDDGIENTLEDFLAVGIENRVGRHQVTDVADEQQAAPGQHHGTAVRRRVSPVLVERARHRLAVFFERRLQIGLHQPEPVGVDGDLVLGIHRCHRVFTVLDRRDCRLEDDVREMRGRVTSDRMLGIDPEFEVQAVIAEQVGALSSSACVARKLSGLRQRDRAAACHGGNERGAAAVMIEAVGVHVRVTCTLQRDRAVEKRGRIADDSGATRRVVAAATRLAVLFADGIGTVKCVVKAAPARVRGVQCEPAVADRYHELWSGDLRDFGVDVVGFDLERIAVRHEVADIAQESHVFIVVPVTARVGRMPGVDPGLQLVALLEQCTIDRGQVVDQRLEPRPEVRGLDADHRQEVTFDKLVEHRGNAQTALLLPFVVTHLINRC